MLVEDVFEQIRSQTYIPVTLDELNRTPQACLQAFDHLLRQTEESQNAARAKEAEAQDKVAHLSSSIKQLAEQNARLNTRLLASLDALSVASGTTVNAYNDENEALRLLNHNLALRLHDAQQKQSELRDAIASMTEPARAVNNESAKQRARMVANEHIHSVRILSETQQDEDGISDAGTEMQANYQALPEVYESPDGGGNAAARHMPQQEIRLRTRTILMELANELEATRRDMAAMQVEKQQATSMLQSQIDTRDKELATLYNQVDRFFGLPGFALTKVCKNDVRGQEASIGKETEEKLANTLQLQLQELKKDVQRLTAEKDNIARYGVGEVYTNFAIASPSKGPYRTESASHLSDQEAKFERVARRARERLVEQESMIDALKSELSKAQDSLRSVQLSQPEDVFSTRYDTSGVLNQNRTVLGGSIQRPRSALADPYAGSSLFGDGMPVPRLEKPWVPEE